MKKGKVLVTGGAGFIGSHLVNLLLKKGYKVNIFVRKGKKIHWRYRDAPFKNCVEELKRKGVGVFYGDLLDKKSLIPALKDVDTIYHLGAVASPYFGLPEKAYMDISIIGTKNLLELVTEKKIKLKRFVYVSSIEAAGPSISGKKLIEGSQTAPIHAYGRSKLATENLLENYKSKVPIVVVRPPMQFGEGDPLLLKLIRYIKNPTGLFPMFGSGKALFEFCYVKNTVHGMYLAGTKKKAIGQTYFISDGSKRIIDTVKEIAIEYGAKVRIIHLPLFFAYVLGLLMEILNYLLPFPPFRHPKTGVPLFTRTTVEWVADSKYFCSIEKAKKELGYKPQFTLQRGLRNTIEWYKKEGYL